MLMKMLVKMPVEMLRSRQMFPSEEDPLAFYVTTQPRVSSPRRLMRC